VSAGDNSFERFKLSSSLTRAAEQIPSSKMSDNGVKVENEHVDVHEEGGDDEVRAGFSFRNLDLRSRPATRAKLVALASRPYYWEA